MKAVEQVGKDLIITNRKRSTWQIISSQKALILMSLPFVLQCVVFKYIPIWGWLMAFQEYVPGKSLFFQQWTGLENFRMIFQDRDFIRVVRNTLAMSSLKLILGFVTSIGLALCLNEVRITVFKRTVQTISYLPHFISWVVAANIVSSMLSTENGIVNKLLLTVGFIDQPVLWLGKPEYFWTIIGISHIWKEVGWGAIIYLGGIAGIDPQLYEAAIMDGAGRIKRMIHVTLPGIKPIIVVLLIMNIGHILEAGFEAQYLLGNSMVIDYSEVIDIYVLRYGISMMRFSYATAAGIFKSVVSLVLVLSANYLSKKMGEERII